LFVWSENFQKFLPLTSSKIEKLYFLQRAKDKFRIRIADVGDSAETDLVDKFKVALEDLIKEISNGEREIVDFYDPYYTDTDMSVLNIDDISPLKLVTENMPKVIEFIHDLSEVTTYKVFALEFEFSEKDRIIYFRRIQESSFLPRRKWVLFSLQNNKFRSLDQSVFAMDKDIDCIYFVKGGKVVLINKKNTETIFGFKEYYKQLAEETLDKWLEKKLIDIDDSLRSMLVENTHKKITQLMKNGKSDSNILKFRTAKEYLESRTEYRSLGQQIIIQNNTLKVGSSKKALELILAISDDDLQQDIVQHLLYMVKKKELI
jgi:hypothetical protein